MGSCRVGRRPYLRDHCEAPCRSVSSIAAPRCQSTEKPRASFTRDPVEVGPNRTGSDGQPEQLRLVTMDVSGLLPFALPQLPTGC